MRPVLTSLTVLTIFSALLAFSPPAAHAIPVVGDYEFTHFLTGTFTSDGNTLTAWDITAVSPQFSGHWTSTDPNLNLTLNNESYFRAKIPTSTSGIDVYLYIDWLQSSAVAETTTGYLAASSFAYTRVPEPSGALLLLAGLVTIAIYSWGQQRRTGLQVR